MLLREDLQELLEGPGGRRMSRDMAIHEPPTPHLHEMGTERGTDGEGDVLD